VFGRSARAADRLSDNQVPDREQLEVGPFVEQPRFRTRSTHDRSRSHSPILVEMHDPHVAGASDVAARSPPNPVVQSRRVARLRSG
jgi:hypothetical protein